MCRWHACGRVYRRDYKQIDNFSKQTVQLDVSILHSVEWPVSHYERETF